MLVVLLSITVLTATAGSGETASGWGFSQAKTGPALPRPSIEHTPAATLSAGLAGGEGEAGQAERPAVVSPNMSSSPPGKHQFIHVPPSTTLVKKLKFIHVTKTGGTSIEALGVSMNVSWGKHDRDYGKLKSHHLIVERKNPDLLEQYDWFLVVRNLFARIVSEFWCKWGGKGRPANPTPASFNAFLRNRMSNVQSATATTRGHYVPMWRYYTPYPKVVIRVARFETLERDLRAIFGLYNLTMPTSLPHVYATPHPLSVQHLDQQTLAMIRRVYATDFEIFRYSLDERLAFSPDRAHWGRPGQSRLRRRRPSPPSAGTQRRPHRLDPPRVTSLAPRSSRASAPAFVM